MDKSTRRFLELAMDKVDKADAALEALEVMLDNAGEDDLAKEVEGIRERLVECIGQGVEEMLEDEPTEYERAMGKSREVSR